MAVPFVWVDGVGLMYRGVLGVAFVAILTSWGMKKDFTLDCIRVGTAPVVR